MGESEPKLPPGFRFHPTDEELVNYYLTRKVADSSFSGQAIAEIDLNKCEPWDLPEKAKMGGKEWYFFCLRDRKYPTGLRTNRATVQGYWKATGKDREVLNARSRKIVGMKKTLVFYRGRAPRGSKTNWVMHEYRLETDIEPYHRLISTHSQDDWVVCRIFQKSAVVKKNSSAFGSRSSYNDMGSPTLPPLLESPATTVHEFESRCGESESRSAPRERVSCFSNAMDALKDHCGGFGSPSSCQAACGTILTPADSAELSDIANIVKSSPFYLQSLMLTARPDDAYNSPPGQEIQSPPPPLHFSHLCLPPSSVTSSLPSAQTLDAAILKSLVDDSCNEEAMGLKQCKLEPNSSFGLIHHDSIDGTQFQHYIHLQTAATYSSPGDQPVAGISVHDTSDDMVTLNRPYDQVGTSASSPLDMGCLWSY
eukprot:Gb_13930 [translate_table: standard]